MGGGDGGAAILTWFLNYIMGVSLIHTWPIPTTLKHNPEWPTWARIWFWFSPGGFVGQLLCLWPTFLHPLQIIDGQSVAKWSGELQILLLENFDLWCKQIFTVWHNRVRVRQTSLVWPSLSQLLKMVILYNEESEDNFWQCDQLCYGLHKACEKQIFVRLIYIKIVKTNGGEWMMVWLN